MAKEVRIQRMGKRAFERLQGSLHGSRSAEEKLHRGLAALPWAPPMSGGLGTAAGPSGDLRGADARPNTARARGSNA